MHQYSTELQSPAKEGSITGMPQSSYENSTSVKSSSNWSLKKIGLDSSVLQPLETLPNSSKPYSPQTLLAKNNINRQLQEEESSISSNCTFFHKEKHQTNYFLLEFGQLYIKSILQPNKRYLLNSAPLNYKLVLMTNESTIPNCNEHINPEKCYMILGKIQI